MTRKQKEKQKKQTRKEMIRAAKSLTKLVDANPAVKKLNVAIDRLIGCICAAFDAVLTCDIERTQ